MQEEALHQMHAKVLHRLELLRALDALGDHHGAVIVREAHHRLHQVLLDEVGIDGVDQGDVELDKIRLEVRDRSQAGVPTARVVDGKAKAALAKCLQPPTELGIVLDGRALRDFDDDARRFGHLVLVEHRSTLRKSN
jgi:hypothetical protein